MSINHGRVAQLMPDINSLGDKLILFQLQFLMRQMRCPNV